MESKNNFSDAMSFANSSTEMTWDEAYRLLKLIAMHPQTPPAVLAMMTERSSPSILERIASNPNGSAEVIEFLATHPDSEVRMAVCENPSVAEDTLMILVNDPCADVRHCLAENHNIPERVLEALTEDENPYVVHRARRTLERRRESGNLADKLAHWFSGIARERQRKYGAS